MSESKDEEEQEADTPKNNESKFGIFHKNRFFELTPLSGWAFVYAAKTAKEIVFWYVIILTFIGLTIYNVHNLVTYYASGPTSTNVLLQTSTSDLSLPNMTIKLKMPIIELMNRVVLDMSVELDLQDPVIYYDEIINQYLCKKQDMKDNDPTLEEKDHLLHLRSSIEMLQSMVNIKAHSVRTTLSNTTQFQEWNMKINQGKDALKNVWQHLLDIRTANQMELNSIVKNLNRETNGGIDGKVNDTLQKLFLLNGLTTTDTHNDVKKALENMKISVEQLYTNTAADIANIVHVDTHSNATVSFVDYELRETYYTTSVLTMSLIPDPGIKELNFKIYLSNYMWIIEVINALKEALEEFDDGWVMYLKCEDGTYFYRIFSSLINLVHRFYTYETGLEIEIHFEKSMVVKRTTGFEHTLSINPLVKFNSQIDNCFNGTLETCMDGCISEEYLRHHDCLLWNTDHTDADTKLCDQHFEEPYEQKCMVECSQKLLHPCALILRHVIHKVESGIFPPDDDIALYSINIVTPKNHNFAQFVEEYAIKLESFLFLLGGALEFWSGINILGIIHFLVFMIIQCASNYLGTRAETNNDQDLNIVLIEKELDNMMAKAHISDYEGIKPWTAFRSWLRGNQLYEQTPISGYAYIAAAKTIREVVYWYVVVGCFLLFAFINGYNTMWSYYVLKPTRAQLTPSASIERFSIPNMTLQLHLPLLQLVNFKINPRFDVSEEPLTDDLWDSFIYESPKVVAETENALLKDWSIALNKTNLELTHFTGNSHRTLVLNDRSVTEQWQQLITENANAAEKSFINFKNISWDQIQHQLLPRLTQYQDYHPTDSNLLTKLIILQGIKYAKSPYEIIHDTMYDSSDSDNVYNSNNILEEQGWTVSELYSETMSALSEQLYIVIDNEAAVVSLKDFSLNQSESVGQKVHLDLELTLPIGVKELEIEIGSFLCQWLIHAIYGEDWLYQHVTSIKDTHDRSTLLYLIASIIYQEVYEAWAAISDSFLRLDSSITLHQYTIDNGITCEIKIFPAWSMTSKTHGCSTVDLEWCVTQCQLEQYQRQCGCYPWHVVTHATGTEMCEEACHVETSVCDHQCNTPCERHWVEVPTETQSGGIGKPYLQRVHIKIEESLYPQLLEEYEMTSSSFISNVGAILDFWLGINLLALVHLCVYIMKKCSSAHKLLNKGENEVIRLAKLQKQQLLDKIRSTIGEKMSCLRAAAMEGKLVTKQHTAFSWLRDNKFFQQTNMTGFTFISASQHYVEVIFWWLLIIFFSGITGFNIHSAFMEYNTKPTQTAVNVGRNKTETQIGNLTLTFQVPLTEFSKLNPLYFPMYHDNTKLEEDSESVGHYLFCVISKGGNILPLTLDDMFINWLHLLNDSWIFEDKQEMTSLAQWSEGFGKASEDLLKFLDNGKLNKVAKNTKIAKQLQNQFNALLNKPMERLNDAHKRLMLLEALKHGQHPREALFKKFKNEYEFFDDSNPIEQASDNTMASDILSKAGINAKDLYEQVQDDLSHVVQIEYGRSSGVQAVLQDWSYDTRNQELKYAVAVSPDVDEFNMQINFYSNMWQREILKTFYNYFASQGQTDGPLCDGMDIEEIMDMHKGRMQTWLFGTNWLYNIRLDTHHGESIHGSAGQHEEYIARPNSHFHSHTQTCFHGSRERCLDMCLAESHLSSCHCVPWNFIYLQLYDDSSVCTESCDSVERNRCEAECEKTLLHPCEMTLYQLELEVDAVEDSETVYSLTVKKAEATKFVIYAETYGFTLASFMAHLGGLFELWMGINLLSFIHLITYFVKQIMKSRNECLSTNKSIHPENAVESQLLAIKILEQRLLEELNEKQKQLQLETVSLKQKSAKE